MKTIKLASHIRIDQIVNWLKKDCSIEIHGFNIFIVTDNNMLINVITEANRK